MTETLRERDSDEPTSPPAIRLRRLVIEELFGPGSAVIDISFKLDKRVTILHGRNGSGKTITLNLIQALSTGNLNALQQYPFTRLLIELTDDSTLEILQTQAEEEHAVSQLVFFRRLEYVAKIPGEPLEQGSLTTRGPTQARLAAIARALPWLKRVGKDRWFDERTGRRMSSKAVEREFIDYYVSDEVPDDIIIGRDFAELSFAVASTDETNEHHDTARPLLRRLLGHIPKVKHIRADRLFIRDEDENPRIQRRAAQSRLMVERLSENIRALVRNADRKYRRTSTSLDSSLPKRLFATSSDQQVPTIEELKKRSKDLEEQATLLSSLGLLSDESKFVGEEKLREDQKKTFFIILQDQEAKLKPFADVVEKSQRLLDTLNRKLAPKRVLLDVQDGYKIQTADGSDLPLNCLSSGEQHELVLLHELLFQVSPGSLILIDEPELSLHVTWQQDMLKDLLAVAELSELDIVIATHSPYIVGGHEELMVRLGEPS